MKLKVSVILGTRPEAIKLAPLILALKQEPGFECQVCLTGQHREMVDQVLPVFGIVPDTDLKLMRAGQSLSALSARAIEAVDEYLASAKPDLVFVQGDTTTVLCASLAGFYRKIPVGHVEAGLRTGNMCSPWPEEANRVLTSRLASIHFAPTETNRQSLLREGIRPEQIHVTGNTGIDALLIALEEVRKNPPDIPGLPHALQPIKANSTVCPQRPPIVLITGHRRENFGEGFRNICEAILGLAALFPDVHFVYPVHLNPNVRGAVQAVLGPKLRRNTNETAPASNIHLIEPLSYLEFVALMSGSTLILTDSGGVQEEAPSLGVPVLVMRDTTERTEAVRAGTVKLVGAVRDSIVTATSEILRKDPVSPAVPQMINPYGDGHASARIVKASREFLDL